MLRWIALALVVVVLVGAMTFMSMNSTIADAKPAAAVALVPSGPAAKLELGEPPTYEFGTMSQLSGGKHTWEIKNVGEVDLELTLGATTCSCTIAKLKSSEGPDKPKLVVKPHGSTKVDVEWQTKTFRDDYSQGVTLTTNDPANSSVSIRVHGMVHPPVIVVPGESISFGSASNEEAQVKKVAVFSMDRPETKITKLTSSRPEFLVPKFERLSAEDCKMVRAKNGGYWVTVEMKPGMPLGRFQDELVIETDHPLKPDVKLAVSGNAVGPISVIPERVRMPSVSSSQGGSREIALLVRGGRPTKFDVIRHPEKLNVTIALDEKSTQKGRYKMTVIVPPGTAAGPVDGEIVIRTDHPRAAEMKIPVTIGISNSGSD